jgi:hypothetical protein
VSLFPQDRLELACFGVGSVIGAVLALVYVDEIAMRLFSKRAERKSVR